LYEKATATAAVLWKEQHLYGSSRLGMWQVPATPPTATQEPAVDSKLFELSNHLGNVLATLSDKKLGYDTTNDGQVDYFLPDVRQVSDYHPFGMAMNNRTFTYNLLGYKAGFNGKDLDKETNSYDFGERIYDPRLAKWLSLDPIKSKFPHESPYMFAGANPIFYVDEQGNFKIKHLKGEDRKAALKVIEAMRNEVEDWKGESDPRFIAFQKATGVKDIAFIKNKLLKNGNGPQFMWGDAHTIKLTNSKDDDGHVSLARGNGQGFLPGSSYAVTNGRNQIVFDEGLKQIALRVIDLETQATKQGLIEFVFTLPDNSQFSARIGEEVKKAMTFLSRNGIHEFTHKARGMTSVIPASEGDVANIITTDEYGRTRMQDRGDFFEILAYKVNLGHADVGAGIIPLLVYAIKVKACQLPSGSPCFQTDQEKKDAHEKMDRDLKEEVEKRGYKPASNNK
jgi:RHS repeat-associated protein